MKGQIEVFLFCFMRPFGFALIFPIFNANSIGGALVRNSFALLAAFVFVPLIHEKIREDLVLNSGVFFSMLAIELFVGVALGLVLSAPFYAVQIAGEVLDNTRGATIANVISPLTNQEESILGIFFYQILLVLFISSGCLDFAIDTLARSYEWIDVGHKFSTQAGLQLMLSEWGYLMAEMLSVAAPAIIVMLIVDISLGLVNRAVSNIEVFALAMPIKSLLGFVVLTAGIKNWAEIFNEWFRAIVQELALRMGN